jgi:hypothetical protein
MSHDAVDMISKRFDKIHEMMADMREQVNKLDDPVANHFMDEYEVASLARLRSLRRYLSIPYFKYEDNII